MEDNNKALAAALMDAAHRFYRMGYQMSDGGNLSARIPNTDIMLVKGTNVDFGALSADTLVVSDFEGNLVHGSVAPSKEGKLHGAIYAAFPDIGGIMHCHSPWATAWAAGHDALAFSTYHAELKLGGFCPVFDTGSYVVDAQHIQLIVDTMRRRNGIRAFLLRGHGQVTVGKDIRDAAMLAELVEETAKIATLAKL